MEKDVLNRQIGQRVRSLREYHGYTRERLCALADISVQFLAEIEAGRKSMTTHTLYKMAKALHVSADFLLFGESGETSVGAGGIIPLLDSLDEAERETAEELLKVFIQGLSRRRS